MENVKLTKEIMNLKTKVSAYESEIKNLKAENFKLKEVNTVTLQEQIRKLKAEIEKLQIMDKDRLAVLSELEEKNNKLRELNTSIQMVQSEKEQIQKDFDNVNINLNEIKKQNELKDVTIAQLNKKNDNVIQEKEQLFFDYQKKIELLQMKLLDSVSGNESEESLSKVISLLKESVDEIKKVFLKKFDNFMENFNQVKIEYNLRDEKFTSLLNEKSIMIMEQVQKFSSNFFSDVEKAFDKVNKPTVVKDQKIDWLNKQISELNEYKKKGIELEKKVSQLTNEVDVMKKKIELGIVETNSLKKNIELKDQAIANDTKKIEEFTAKLNDCTNFVMNKTDQLTWESFKNQIKI